MQKRLLASFLLLALAVAEDSPANYVASTAKKGDPFHVPTCAAAKRILAKNLVTYATRDDAIKDGHRPYLLCNP